MLFVAYLWTMVYISLRFVHLCCLCNPSHMYTNVGTSILNKENNVSVCSSDNFRQFQLSICILVMILCIMCSASPKKSRQNYSSDL